MMGILSAGIFTLWGLSILCEIGLIGVLLRQKLARRYAGVTLWAAVSAASGIHTAYAHFVTRSYAAVWAAWEPITLAALILVTADVAHKIGSQWPAASRLAWGINALFGGLAAVAMGRVAEIFPAAEWGAVGWTIRLKEHFALACAATIAANWMIYSIPHPQWKKNARRHVRAGFLLTAGLGGAAFILAAWGREVVAVAIANSIITGLPGVCCVIWARMSRKGEEYATPRPQGTLLESLEALDRRRTER